MSSFNMLQNSRLRIVLHLFYFIFSTAYILAGQLDIGELRIFKVFPLGLVILLMLPKSVNVNVAKLILAVLFGALGDLVLQYEGHQPMMFAVGAGFFFIGHVLYNLAMLDLWQSKSVITLIYKKLQILLGNFLWFSLSFVNLSTTVTDKMREQNQMMLYLLPLYLIVLTFNVVNAYMLLLASKNIDRYHVMLFIGTLMFLISDNVLGRAVFTGFKIFGERKINSLVIMITYYLAQYFIGLNVTRIWNSQAKHEENDDQRISLITESDNTI